MKTVIRTGLPSASWRDLDEGRPELIKRDWPYKERAVMTNDILNELFYGDDNMPKRKCKSKIKKGPPSKREKELQEILNNLEQENRSNREYYNNKDKAWEQSLKEKNYQIKYLERALSVLEQDKRFLQTIIQHLLPGKN